MGRCWHHEHDFNRAICALKISVRFLYVCPARGSRVVVQLVDWSAALPLHSVSVHRSAWAARRMRDHDLTTPPASRSNGSITATGAQQQYRGTGHDAGMPSAMHDAAALLLLTPLHVGQRNQHHTCVHTRPGYLRLQAARLLPHYFMQTHRGVIAGSAGSAACNAAAL